MDSDSTYYLEKGSLEVKAHVPRRETDPPKGLLARVRGMFTNSGPAGASSARSKLSSTKASPRRAIPSNVCERIIDYVAAAYGSGYRTQRAPSIQIAPTLRACSLVCRAWTSRSQFHLFRNVVVRRADHGPDALGELLATRADLGEAVKELLLCLQGGDEDEKRISLGDLVLPELRNLRIIEGAISLPRTGAAFDNSPHQVSSVTHLYLDTVTFRSPSDLQRIICELPSIEDLGLWKLSWSNADIDDSIKSPAPSIREGRGLEVLHINVDPVWMRDGRTTDLLTWIAESGLIATLRSAFIAPIVPASETADAVCALLRAPGDSLRHLWLTWDCTVDDAALATLPSILSECPKLESLNFLLPLHTPALVQLTTFLHNPKIPCPTLLKLCFVHTPACRAPRGDSWRALDAALCQPHWAAARFVRIERLAVPAAVLDVSTARVLRVDIKAAQRLLGIFRAYLRGTIIAGRLQMCCGKHSVRHGKKFWYWFEGGRLMIAWSAGVRT